MMRLFNIFIIIVLAIVVYRGEGALSAFEWFLAVLVLWLSFTERYSLFFIFIFIFSLGLSMHSLSKTVSENTSVDEMKIYQTGTNRGLTNDLSECGDFNRVDVGRVRLAKEEQFKSCSLQVLRDMIHQLISVIFVFYSGLYNEIAIAVPFFPRNKLDNKCLHSINKVIQLCPSEAVYYNKIILDKMNRKDATQ